MCVHFIPLMVVQLNLNQLEPVPRELSQPVRFVQACGACLLAQAALNSRHPDSLPALIAAAKPSAQEAALVSDVQTQLKTLQVHLTPPDYPLAVKLQLDLYALSP